MEPICAPCRRSLATPIFRQRKFIPTLRWIVSRACTRNIIRERRLRREPTTESQSHGERQIHEFARWIIPCLVLGIIHEEPENDFLRVSVSPWWILSQRV